MTDDNATIARLEEEKAILWTIIEELEVWMHGEGCFISARTKAKIDIARTLMAPVKEDVNRYRERLFACYKKDQLPPKPDRRRKEKSPEERVKQSERMRAYWDNIKKQRSTT